MTTTNDLRITRRWIAVGALCSIAGSGVFVWASTHARETARQDNCEVTYRAIRDFTQKLGDRLGADQREIDEFLVELEPIRDQCT